MKKASLKKLIEILVSLSMSDLQLIIASLVLEKVKLQQERQKKEDENYKKQLVRFKHPHPFIVEKALDHLRPWPSRIIVGRIDEPEGEEYVRRKS